MLVRWQNPKHVAIIEIFFHRPLLLVSMVFVTMGLTTGASQIGAAFEMLHTDRIGNLAAPIYLLHRPLLLLLRKKPYAEASTIAEIIGMLVIFFAFCNLVDRYNGRLLSFIQ